MDLELGEQLDTELFQLFEPPGCRARLGRADAARPAADAHPGRDPVLGREPFRRPRVVDHLTDRTDRLKLTATPDRASGYVANLGSLVTALAMNELYTGRLFDTE